ncbi:MAG: long-chain fatty acid--CoA ligase [Nitriliruptor sp.]|uniref:long-chain fatty acid--CoA ligase n=1 Tax=Nitriliruptor sp. TaxID=2448056 RepID=UPI0034A02461
MAVATVDDEVATERQRHLERIEGRTLLDVFRATVDAHRGQPALVVARPDGSFRTRTWGEYEDEASRVAMALRRFGVDHGDLVALMITNRPEHVIADVGTLLAGATPVSVYNTLAPDQVAYVAGNCDAKVAIVEDAAVLATWQQVRDQLPNLERIVVIEAAGVDTSDPTVTTYEQLLTDGASALAGGRGELDNAWRSVSPDDPLTLIYTSGTTGPPKGVVLTHRNLLFQMEVTQEFLDVQPGQRSVSYLPLAHIAERMATHYLAIQYAGTVSFVQEIANLLPTLLQSRPQSLMAVPRVWEKMHAALRAGIDAEEDERRRKVAQKAIAIGMEAVELEMRGEKVPLKLRLQHAAFDKVVFTKIREKLGFDQLKYSLSGAAPISADLLIFFKAIGIEILEVYGMTESTAVITANRPGRVRIGTVGEPVPGTEVEVAADGEVLARGPHITPGYWRRDEATAEAIDPDGWLHTGDLGRLEDGYLTIVGPKKELIITAGGKNLSPNNVEESIKQRSIIIGQLCAVGDGRPFISALVVLDAEMLPLWCYQNDVTFSSVEAAAAEPKVLAEVQRAVDEGNASLARVEQVRRWAIVPNEWTAESEELTPSLKLKRSVIHDKYAPTIDDLYADS